jgi:hypothetical protein
VTEGGRMTDTGLILVALFVLVMLIVGLAHH